MPYLRMGSPVAAQARDDIARLITEVDDLSHECLKLKGKIANLETLQACLLGALSHYAAPHVVRSLLRNPAQLRLGGKRQRATILFADICGFTQRSARLRPEDVVVLLNRYLEQAIEVIFAHDGLLDKLYGDGLMAVFGPPCPQNDDAARALKAGLALLGAARRLSASTGEPLELTIGIASGTVVAGHIGSTQRMDYTVIGDAVNLASRLETRAEAGSILCDEATFQAAGLDLPFTRFSTAIRGLDDVFTIYRIEGHSH